MIVRSVLLLDLIPHLARNPRPDEPVEQISGEDHGSGDGHDFFHKIRKKPITKMATTTFTNGRLVRQSIFLNDGYFTSLTIMNDRKTRITGRI